MKNSLKMDFCTSCRKETEYTLKKSTIKRTIKGKDYEFNITIATCNNCGEEMAIPGLIDKNIQEVDEQYRRGYYGEKSQFYCNTTWSDN